MQQVMKRDSNVPKRASNSTEAIPRHAKRRLIASLLRRLFAEGDTRENRPIHFEPLETAKLMAADFFQGASPYMPETSGQLNPFVPAVFSQSMTTSGLVGEGEDNGEGENGQNLVEFAKALAQAGVRFFGADWCPICTQQKQLLKTGLRSCRFIEVTNPDRTRNSVGVSENITQYPTWEFPNGSRVTGLQTWPNYRLNLASPSRPQPARPLRKSQTRLFGSVNPLHFLSMLMTRLVAR